VTFQAFLIRLLIGESSALAASNEGAPSLFKPFHFSLVFIFFLKIDLTRELAS
jgi:hypothetical protein